MNQDFFQKLEEEVNLCGQGHVLQSPHKKNNLETLLEVNQCYQPMGGIKGYHKAVLSLIESSEDKQDYIAPYAFPISHSPEEMLLHGIRGQKEIVEFYPMGGACERLAYAKEGEDQPAALFPFLGYTLLEYLIRDLEGREAIYRDTFGEKIETPIVLMVSDAKKNMLKIKNYLEEHAYFGRNKEHIYLIKQPLVPTVDRQGKWQLDQKGVLKTKPGGHGMLWSLVKTNGLYQKFIAMGKRKIFVRQINNPIAGLDQGLITFIGWGYHHDQHFGFYACDRKSHLKEGVHVIRKTKHGYCLSNQEYCALSDQVEDYAYSNTNLLFADIEAIDKVIEQDPFPGLLLNFKSDNTARLESSMQNISEHFCAQSVDEYTMETFTGDSYKPRSFMTSNFRHKTMSVTKKPFSDPRDIEETPMGALRDYLLSMEELLTQHCHCAVPKWSKSSLFSEIEMPFFFQYHPQLGPAFSIIGTKISNIKWSPRSACFLECKHAHVSNSNIEGSVAIHEQKLGSSKVFLEKVVFSNSAFLFPRTRDHLANIQLHDGGFSLILEENAQFVAKEVPFIGPHSIIVPKNTIMRVLPKGSHYQITYEKNDD